MSWKIGINEQLKEASKNRAIGSNLKNIAKELTRTDNEFSLVFSSFKQQYVNVRLKNKINAKGLKAINKISNIHVVKSLIKNKRLY